MKTKVLIKLNSYIFLTYLAVLFFISKIDFSLLVYVKIFLGLAIFFVVGYDLALAIKYKFDLKLDFWETILIGLAGSLFFVPLVLFLVYKMTGKIDATSNMLVYFGIALFSLIFLKYAEKNATRKI